LISFLPRPKPGEDRSKGDSGGARVCEPLAGSFLG